MALAATVFETSENEDEVAALQWLEKLPAPEIHASDASNRSLVKYYVPVNDKMTVNTSVLQSTPGLSRSKQERSYPTSIPLDTNVTYVWRNVDLTDTHLKALRSICSNVIRVGHSSSLVRASAALHDDRSHSSSPKRIRWEPVSRSSDIRVRMAGEGEFERLKAACNADQIDEFVDLKLTIESTKGKAQQEAKEVFEKLFGQPYGKNLRAPEATPATLGLWQGYRRSKSDASSSQALQGQHFDSELLILTKIEGRNLGVQDALALTSRLREAAMSHCPLKPTPAWLGGHDMTSGKPTDLPHTAFLALPFVGAEYSDGHVMGLALALPNSDVVSPAERGRLLGPLFYDENGDPCNIELKLGNRGIWILRLEERPEPPLTLQNRSWVGPSQTWASVTPVVLDRFPKKSLSEDRRAWEAEVRETIANSCTRAGLPLPIEIDLETTPWHTGTPRSYSKSRPLRSHSLTKEMATLGDGFQLMPGRQGKPSRPQIHVFLRFEQPLLGPVLIGAGRFLGYGLCKPIRMERKMK
jgi:CRISPR-associated protein Csb2